MQAPQAPDPIQTSEQQLKLNTDTAFKQQQMNMVDQTNPFGKTTFTQDKWPDGTPKFTSTTSLNAPQQQIFDNISKIGGNVTSSLQTPFSLDNKATEDRLMELGRNRLDPALDRRRASTEQSLFNRGVRPGTAAYDRGMEAVSQGENDAYNELLLRGRSQAVNEAVTQRQQPLNEWLAMMSGQQLQTPQASVPQSGIAPPDYTGMVNNQFQQQQQNYNNMWGGIGSIGSTIGGWMFSDERLKEDEQKVGTSPEGIPIKTFRYKGSPMMQLGVMAQDVQKRRPDAVRTGPGGYKQVNYPALKGGGLMALGAA